MIAAGDRKMLLCWRGMWLGVSRWERMGAAHQGSRKSEFPGRKWSPALMGQAALSLPCLGDSRSLQFLAARVPIMTAILSRA